MYEQQTFEAILKRMLNRIPADLDKREGSIIYDALAPAAAELAQFYMEIDKNIRLSYADTSSGEFLGRRTAEFGLARKPAISARRKGLFYNSKGDPVDVPIGSRFSIDQIKYVVVEKRAAGEFEMLCETPGEAGNRQFGAMLPIDYIKDLTRAELSEVLVHGEDEESDEALRQRYLEAINEQPFGGNVSDYRQKIKSIPGVGGVKVFPVWQGGGTVKCTIIASDFSPPAEELIEEVQTRIDPSQNKGKGEGLAPIGHEVAIHGVQGVPIDVETTVTLDSETTLGQVQEEIEAIIEDYLLSLRKVWNQEDRLTVRVSQLEARILSVKGIADITQTKLNGDSGNLELGGEEVPIQGGISIHA
ncbi:baseplate J/gp47 family protein [Paenibacillus sp. J2TS4]|uniref:baseplate J/gp47 family protein n=1 Tax=Paenibacillus sp. J2TS4 TaxID=2807194 RepID=UPI001B1B4F0B|nr:baseplate J/gp47 family protein [Paenibacillus sp. J2TS4]GIP35513.1 phage tail protein [Paenibacillus sp. J2TS4]